MVIIDIGHYNCDSGAVSPNGKKEVELTNMISNEIWKYLKEFNIPVNFTSGKLHDRCNHSNSVNPKYFISIHCNSTSKKGWDNANGFECYIVGKGGQAEKLGIEILNEMTKTGLKNRGLKVASYEVLRHTKCPSVLVECGFMNNENDLNYMYQNYKKIGEYIGKGIVKQLVK